MRERERAVTLPPLPRAEFAAAAAPSELRALRLAGAARARLSPSSRGFNLLSASALCRHGKPKAGQDPAKSHL